MEFYNEYVTEFTWNAGQTRDLYLTTIKYSNNFALKSDLSIKFGLFMDGSEYRTSLLKKGVIAKNIDENKPVRVKIQLWIYDATGGKLYEHVSENFTFSSNDQKCEFGTPQEEKNFLDNAYKNNLGIWFGCKLTHLNPDSSICLPNFKDSLVRKLWNSYEAGLNFDTIIVADGKEFKVLRGILNIHSEVFQHMFSGNYNENTNGKVEINDVSAQVMEEFIKWMYTGEITNMDAIEGLFVASDKYMVTDLKATCAKLMLDTLTGENAARRLVLAAKHNDEALKQKILKFANKKGPEFMFKVMESKAWFDYMKLQNADGN